MVRQVRQVRQAPQVRQVIASGPVSWTFQPPVDEPFVGRVAAARHALLAGAAPLSSRDARTAPG